MTGGRERTEAEFRRLYEAAGFRLTRIVPSESPFSVIEGVHESRRERHRNICNSRERKDVQPDDWDVGQVELAIREFHSGNSTICAGQEFGHCACRVPEA